MVEPVLEFAGEAAPIGRAEDEGVAGEEVGAGGAIEGAVPYVGTRDGVGDGEDGLREFGGEAAGVVEDEDDRGRGSFHAAAEVEQVPTGLAGHLLHADLEGEQAGRAALGELLLQF